MLDSLRMGTPGIFSVDLGEILGSILRGWILQGYSVLILGISQGWALMLLCRNFWGFSDISAGLADSMRVGAPGILCRIFAALRRRRCDSRFMRSS